MGLRASFAMPRRKRVTQIMPAEIMYFSPQQRIAPSLGVYLDDGVFLIGEHVARVVTLPPLQNI